MDLMVLGLILCLEVNKAWFNFRVYGFIFIENIF